MNKLVQKFFIPSLTLGLFFFTSCQQADSEVVTYTSGTPVKISSPKIQTVTEYKRFIGRTEYLNNEIVRSPVNGYVTEIYKQVGDIVKKGDKLFQITTKEAYSDSIELKIGNKSFDGKVLIKASNDGIITGINFNTGNLIMEGEQVASISLPSSLVIRLNVPFELAHQFRIPSSCIVHLTNGESIKSTVTKKLPIVDAATQTQQFFVTCGKLISLPYSLDVEVSIPIKTYPNIKTLPHSSIMANETLDSFWIMKLVDDSTAVKISIKKGIENDSIVQIISPYLNLSDKIVSDGAYGLNDTAKVFLAK